MDAIMKVISQGVLLTPTAYFQVCSPAWQTDRTLDATHITRLTKMKPGVSLAVQHDNVHSWRKPRPEMTHLAEAYRSSVVV